MGWDTVQFNRDTTGREPEKSCLSQLFSSTHLAASLYLLLDTSSREVRLSEDTLKVSPLGC